MRATLNKVLTGDFKLFRLGNTGGREEVRDYKFSLKADFVQVTGTGKTTHTFDYRDVKSILPTEQGFRITTTLFTYFLVENRGPKFTDIITDLVNDFTGKVKIKVVLKSTGAVKTDSELVELRLIEDGGIMFVGSKGYKWKGDNSDIKNVFNSVVDDSIRIETGKREIAIYTV